ncbi:FkbM family methyltransferase [Waterburya agarophytonicola K14]|uniref:FkbM family methyltransferase n=1 Tax=Waterburya agarophytonicola KI4 TaxID=2874699 RepID=A0A964BQY9_9CYAN|nr:FkbM family methyltransferase [Waterburya agarophytonicola]MCC0176657.1 FkbM family methyltransferase [Waterburya agarophytonicola KI4]
MNKILRSLLLRSPKTYELIHNLKNKHFINFYLGKVHEPDFNAFKLICQNQPQLFVDIGANVGMSALSFFTLKSNARVTSFEPNPLNYPYLDKLAARFANFQYLPVGIGEKQTSLDFYYPVYNGKVMTALGSCDRQSAESWLNQKTVYFFNESKLEIAKINIEVKTLDSFELEPEFIKIDVEGFEYQVLLGAENTINTHRPILLIEGIAQGDRVHQLLKAWRYDIYKFEDNRFYLNSFDCANNFVIPQEKTELIQPYLALNSAQTLEPVC